MPDPQKDFLAENDYLGRLALSAGLIALGFWITSFQGSYINVLRWVFFIGAAANLAYLVVIYIEEKRSKGS